jgi:hypothetical protein
MKIHKKLNNNMKINFKIKIKNVMKMNYLIIIKIIILNKQKMI